jgi:hypothetical protein
MHRSKTPAPSRWARLKLAGAGLILAGVGIAWMLNGVQVVRHSTGQPLFSWGLVASGVLCIILAMIPQSWIAKAAEAKHIKAKHLS